MGRGRVGTSTECTLGHADERRVQSFADRAERICLNLLLLNACCITLHVLLFYTLPVTMSALGSVFLGDVQRHRVLSSPPSSPPPVSTFSGDTMPTPVDSEDVLESLDGTESPAKTSASLPQGRASAQTPTTIDPVLSLELRLRWLEALLLGVRQDTRDRKAREKPPELKPGETLVHLAGDVQRRLAAAVDASDGLKKFMHQCTPPPTRRAHALTGMQTTGMRSGSPPRSRSLGRSTPIRRTTVWTRTRSRRCWRRWSRTCAPPTATCARLGCSSKRACSRLGNSQVRARLLSPGRAHGRCVDYEALQPRLQALVAAQEQDVKFAAALEKRIAALVERHVTHVSSLLFDATFL